MDSSELYWKLRKHKENNDNNSKKRHLDLSKNNLNINMKKKMKTIMIGAIAKFEKFFGNQWGFGKDDSECGQKEDEIFDIWEKCRQEILDLGNKQIRDTEAEIERYNVNLKGYNIKFN